MERDPLASGTSTHALISMPIVHLSQVTSFKLCLHRRPLSLRMPCGGKDTSRTPRRKTAERCHTSMLPPSLHQILCEVYQTTDPPNSLRHAVFKTNTSIKSPVQEKSGQHGPYPEIRIEHWFPRQHMQLSGGERRGSIVEKHIKESEVNITTLHPLLSSSDRVLHDDDASACCRSSSSLFLWTRFR